MIFALITLPIVHSQKTVRPTLARFLLPGCLTTKIHQNCTISLALMHWHLRVKVNPLQSLMCCSESDCKLLVSTTVQMNLLLTLFPSTENPSSYEWHLQHTLGTEVILIFKIIVFPQLACLLGLQPSSPWHLIATCC